MPNTRQTSPTTIELKAISLNMSVQETSSGVGDMVETPVMYTILYIIVPISISNASRRVPITNSRIPSIRMIGRIR